ncbi:MAG: hypothetical protein HQM16_16850 [Deltaproteobacteria bacterium]|nr:hypothetical protein [Deltaproteobacteria bacterium]
MDTLDIKYIFTLTNAKQVIFDLKLNSKTLELYGNEPPKRPDWTRLENKKCPNCTLDPKEHSHCPLAGNLVNVVEKFAQILSFEESHVEVVTHKRTITLDTTAQKGIAALMGLISATSGCPHTRFFKPMARFHLPFADHLETTYRSASMYLLGQYFKKQQGEPVNLDLKGLAAIYNEVQTVNTFVSARLRDAATEDSANNALVLLDIHTKLIPFAILDSLEDVRAYFDVYLEKT